MGFEAALSKPAQCADTPQSPIAQMVAVKADIALLAEDKCGRRLPRLGSLDRSLSRRARQFYFCLRPFCLHFLRWVRDGFLAAVACVQFGAVLNDKIRLEHHALPVGTGQDPPKLSFKAPLGFERQSSPNAAK